MFGIESYFNCPNCKYEGIIDLGVTDFINIKNKGNHLAVRDCPKCKNLIAFRIVEPQYSKNIHFYYNGNHEVISCIETTISSLSDSELKNEELAKEKVLKALNEIVDMDYIDKYYAEIIQIFEINLLNKNPLTGPIGYDLSTIDKNDITSDGCICY